MSTPLERFSGYFHLSWTHSIMRGGFPVPMFKFSNDKIEPLTFHCEDGSMIRPASTFSDFDFGSVPGRAQSFVTATCATRAFAFHDSAFNNHGHWVSTDGVVWKFVQLSQHEVNHWLFRMMNVEGNPLLRCWVAFEGVQVGGSSNWKSHTKPFPIDPGY